MPKGYSTSNSVTGILTMPQFARAFAELTHGERQDNAALWYVDIRGFRSINPKYGFQAGDMVLQATVEGIKKHLAGSMPITRIGGDRFIFLTKGKTFEESEQAFRQLMEDVNDVISEKGVASRITLVGGVYYLRDADYARHDYRRAMDYASIAHRGAKSDLRSLLVEFTDEDLERDIRRVIIEQSIDEALQKGQIEVWYQPQIDYTFGEVVGAEALARWNHPELGWISPTEFIPVLEGCGKIHDLDLHVWEEACRCAERWRSASYGKPVPISVNVSRAEMFELDLMNHFKALKERYGLPEGSLHLEVTESAFVEETARLNQVVKAMRDDDMIIEMDDFGSGLSSLSMLKNMHVDVVKLDMGFVHSGVIGERGAVVLGSVIRMLQALDTPIIAEGVETLEQAEMLKNMGCHVMQGYYFSQPMPLDEFEEYAAVNATAELSKRTVRHKSHLEDLMGFDKESSYLFNEAIGGTMFFFAGDGTSESILVNDQFYEECGLKRTDFGTRKINPINEIDEDFRATMWRAAAEARENGSAMCLAKVRLTGRWIEGVMRFIGESTRGDIYSLNICRSGDLSTDSIRLLGQSAADLGWNLSMLDKIVPYGFVKCAPDDNMTIDYITPKLVDEIGLTSDEFLRTYHNSFIELVVASDRPRVANEMRESLMANELFQCDTRLHHGYGRQMRARLLGRVGEDAQGKSWVYMAVLALGLCEVEAGENGAGFERTIAFDYDLNKDLLVIHSPMPDGSVRDIEMKDWLQVLDSLPENISPSSAAKVLATVNDVRHHPLSGFTDLKCNLRGGAGLRWYHINYTCESDENGDTTVLHGYAQDANDEMGSAKWWRRRAEIDQLTGLLNRSAAEEEINLKMRTHGGGLMFFMDLDGFKRVNDDLGHLVGDDLLREVASVMSEHFREGDVLGRYGGDEFVAFVPLAPGSGDAHKLAEQRASDIIEAVSQIVIPDGTHPGCSVGVVSSSKRGATFYELLEAADSAMYASKLAGKGTKTITTL